MGCFRKQAIRHRSEVYLPRSWGYVFTEPISFMGLFSQTGVHPVKTTAIPWKPQWKPRVWQPFDLVTFRGNRTGNRQPGSHHIALWGANLGCELTGALQRVCVPIVLTGPRTIVAQLAPTGLSRAPECVTFVREVVREGSFMGLVFTISVECVGDLGEWSISGGHRDWSLTGCAKFVREAVCDILHTWRGRYLVSISLTSLLFSITTCLAMTPPCKTSPYCVGACHVTLELR